MTKAYVLVALLVALVIVGIAAIRAARDLEGKR